MNAITNMYHLVQTHVAKYYFLNPLFIQLFLADIDESASKRSKCVQSSENLGEQNPLDKLGHFERVGQMAIAGFSSDESLLYVRDETVELWNALNDPEEDNKNLSIDGPPGTGKSTEAWAWALWKAKCANVKVTWFHLNRHSVVKVLIDGIEGKISDFFMVKIVDIEYSEGSILIVDGVTAESKRDVSFACSNWRRCEAGRRYILVSSVSVTAPLQESLEAKIIDFTVASWTLKQYQDACGNTEFFSAVKKNLRCPVSEEEEEEEEKSKKDKLLLTKYYFAGGCARWMFGFNYYQWMSDFNIHLQKVTSYSILFQGQVGDETNIAVNHLRGVTILRRSDSSGFINDKKYFFISMFTVEKLAQICDDKRKFLTYSYQKAKETQNPAFEGWIFEFDVEYQLCQALKSPSNTFYSEIRSPTTSSTTVADEQSVDDYLVFKSVEDLSAKIMSLEVGKVLWAKPNLWYHRAYDFLCIWKVESTSDGSPLMNMVVANATLAGKHSLILEEVRKLAVDLSEQECGAVGAIRFDFIVPKNARFEVGKVTGRLCEWNNLQGDRWENADNEASLGASLALREVVPTS